MNHFHIKDAPGDVFCYWPQVVWTMRGSMNYSHEMESKQVRNTFRTLHFQVPAQKYIYQFLKSLSMNLKGSSTQNRFILIIFAFIILTSQVSAYFDPGTSSILWQFLLACFLGVTYTLHRFWWKIQKRFRRFKGNNQ
jgi:hypothetical protein